MRYSGALWFSLCSKALCNLIGTAAAAVAIWFLDFNGNIHRHTSTAIAISFLFMCECDMNFYLVNCAHKTTILGSSRMMPVHSAQRTNARENTHLTVVRVPQQIEFHFQLLFWVLLLCHCKLRCKATELHVSWTVFLSLSNFFFLHLYASHSLTRRANALILKMSAVICASAVCHCLFVICNNCMRTK